jgi:hypothetical protein
MNLNVSCELNYNIIVNGGWLILKRVKKVRQKIHEDIQLLFAGKPILARKTLWILAAIILVDIAYRIYKHLQY